MYRFTQLPLLQFEGKDYIQSLAIMRFLGRKYGYYPQDDIEKQYEIDSIMDSFNDYHFGLLKVFTAKTDSDKNTAMKTFFTYHTEVFFNAWEKRLEKTGSGYIVGDSWTTADFTTLAITHTMYNHEHWNHMYDGIMEKYQGLKAYNKKR